MANRRIDAKVTEQYVIPTSRLGGVQGEGNITPIRLWFDSTWSGLDKQVTMLNAHGTNPAHVLLTVLNAVVVPDPLPDGFALADCAAGLYEVTIPHSALAYADKCYLQVRGTTAGVTALSVSTELQCIRASSQTR